MSQANTGKCKNDGWRRPHANMLTARPDHITVIDAAQQCTFFVGMVVLRTMSFVMTPPVKTLRQWGWPPWWAPPRAGIFWDQKSTCWASPQPQSCRAVRRATASTSCARESTRPAPGAHEKTASTRFSQWSSEVCSCPGPDPQPATQREPKTCRISERARQISLHMERLAALRWRRRRLSRARRLAPAASAGWATAAAAPPEDVVRPWASRRASNRRRNWTQSPQRRGPQRPGLRVQKVECRRSAGLLFSSRTKQWWQPCTSMCGFFFQTSSQFRRPGSLGSNFWTKEKRDVKVAHVLLFFWSVAFGRVPLRFVVVVFRYHGAQH